MGKASSNKKVARAAKAGGGRARAAGERNFLFPTALVLVVVLGTLLVVYARENRQAEALEAPLANVDHWHSAYGFYTCDSFEPQLSEFVAPQNGGTHTHGDGLIHIHPFSVSRAGENATVLNWISDAGEAFGADATIDDDELAIPAGDTFTEGESACEGLDGDPIVQVAIWDSGQDAIDGEDPTRVVTEDFGDIRFLADGQAFTIAFAPEGAELPPPPSTSSLADVGADLGVPDEEVPDEADFGADGTDAGDGSDDPTVTTEGSEDTVGSDDTEGSDDTTTTAADDQ